MFIDKLLAIRKRVMFRKLPRIIGLCEPYYGGRIYINIHARRISPAQIYLHELIHALKPNWSEKRVLATERYLWRKLTPRQRHRLYAKLFRHPYKENEE